MEIEDIRRLFGTKHLDRPGLEELKEVCEDVERVAEKVHGIVKRHTDVSGDTLPLRRGIVALHHLCTSKHMLLDAIGLTKPDRGPAPKVVPELDEA